MRCYKCSFSKREDGGWWAPAYPEVCRGRHRAFVLVGFTMGKFSTQISHPAPPGCKDRLLRHVHCVDCVWCRTQWQHVYLMGFRSEKLFQNKANTHKSNVASLVVWRRVQEVGTVTSPHLCTYTMAHNTFVYLLSLLLFKNIFSVFVHF